MCTDPKKTCGCGAGHKTFGACLRSKGLQLGRLADRDKGKAWDAELSAFYDAARQGVVPESTKMPDIRRAMEISEATGRPYGKV